MNNFKRRFELNNHKFRICEVYSYGMSYKAFCKGFVDVESLIGRDVILQESDTLYECNYRVIDASNSIKSCGINKYVKRTYITLAQNPEDRNELERQMRFYIQRDYRGFDSSELWSLDNKILDYLVPRLERFYIACEGHGWASGDGYTKASGIVEKILRGFKLLKEADYYHYFTKSEVDTINQSFNLFKKHFGDLWT